MERFNIICKNRNDFDESMNRLITFIEGGNLLAEKWSYMNNTNAYTEEGKRDYHIFQYKLCDDFSSSVHIKKILLDKEDIKYCIALSHTNKNRSELSEDEIVRTMESFKQILAKLNIIFE